MPDELKGTRLIELPLAAVVAGTQYRGQLEERLEQLIREASQPGIVLFLDEIHLLETAGQSEGGLGAAAVLKPALARGDIAVIGATTADDCLSRTCSINGPETWAIRSCSWRTID